MSGLVFKGDVIYSTGEYLPAPYINKIFLQDDSEIVIENFIFLDDYNDVDLVNSSGDISNSKDEYSEQTLGSLKYYILLMEGFSEETYTSIIKKESNPFVFFHEYNEAIDKGFQGYDGTAISLYTVDVLSNSEKDFFDELGNRITAYSISNSSLDLPPGERAGTFENIDYVFCFTSTFDYDSDAEQIDADDFNIKLLNLQIGDISYERVYEDGEPALQDSIKFYDDAENLYEKVPLQAIDASVHKIGSIDHDYIKDNIESLLEEYSTLYNSETGNDELKNVMNAIYTTLEEHYEDYDIIPRLEQIRRSFTDKTPLLPVGKLYKRFSKRLFNINKTIMQFESVFKKIVYNSKLVDLRSVELPDSTDPSYDENSECLYSKWHAAHVAISNMEDVNDDFNACISGYFFFDYEKALRTRSDLSNFLNVNLLENINFNVPYKNFKIKEVTMSRIENSNITAGYRNSFYPVTKTNSYDDGYDFIADEEFKLDLLETAYGPGEEGDVSDITPENGFITSLVNRAYPGIYDDTSNIDNYRMMCFEFLEYLGNLTASVEGSYQAELIITDTTSELVSDLSSSAYGILEEIKDYALKCKTECVFNSDLGRFNQFFLDGALSTYSAAPQAAPWYTAPVSYAVHLDLFFGTYGADVQKIEDAAKNKTAAINPKDGTVDAVDTFVDDFEELLDIIYSGYVASDGETEILFTTELDIPAVEGAISEVQTGGGPVDPGGGEDPGPGFRPRVFEGIDDEEDDEDDEIDGDIDMDSEVEGTP